MKKVYILSMMLLFVLDGWSQSTSSSQQIDIKFKNGNSVQINANDVDYIDFTETANDNPDTPVVPDNPQPSDKDDGKGNMSGNYLTFVALENGTFKFTVTTGNASISYSLDGGSTWKTLASDVNSPSVSAGQKIMWKGNLTPSSSQYGIGTFSSTGRFNVEGNAMSLLFGDNFIGKTDLAGKDHAFFRLFFDCTGLTNAEKLLLPATTLASYCYELMFDSCTSLKTPPKLPATTLAEQCYAGMFYNCTSLRTAPALPARTLAYRCYYNMFGYCTSLTTAPALPATTLANDCYNVMFFNCTSLTTAPELPATTLTEQCYLQMFYNCTSLRYIKCLATDISATNCTYKWVYGVSSSGTFVKNSSMTSWTTGNHGTPTNWTIQDDTTPGNNSGGSYDDTTPGNDSSGNNDNGKGDMSGNYLTFVALDNSTFKFTVATGNASIHYSLDGGSTWNTLSSGVNSPSVSAGQKIMWKGSRRPKQGAGIGTFSSTGRFNVEGNPMSLLYENFQDKTKLNYNNVFSGLFEGNTNVISARDMVMPATTLSDGCYQGMFEGCTSLTTAPSLPATTMAEFCYDTMFQGCTSLTTAPELPATSLAVCCYQSMFENCTSLTKAPSLPATALADWCYNQMFYCCSRLTTAPALPATTLTECCYQRMFYACTSLTTAPVLPATTLAEECYEGMFTYCRSLNYIKCLATDIHAKDCTTYWLSNVSSSGTFVKDSSMTGWTRGGSGIPSGWTVKNE